jgi:hypothetical protein
LPSGGRDVVVEDRDVDLRPARTTTVSSTAIGASSGAGGSRNTVASPAPAHPRSSVPSLIE